jgi:hypothetical protein
MPSDGIAAVMMFYMLNKIADCTENVVGIYCRLKAKKGINIYGGKQQIAKRRLFTLVGRAG